MCTSTIPKTGPVELAFKFGQITAAQQLTDAIIRQPELAQF